MSVVSVKDLVFNDLLAEIGLKPWWEKIRGYCFAVSVVPALFILYNTLVLTNINCLPLVAENATTCTTISNSQSKFVNTYCSNHSLWLLSYGFTPLGTCVLIIFAANSWTILPDVRNSFRTFIKFEKIIDDLNLPSDELSDLSTELKTGTNGNEWKKVRKACTLLWKHSSESFVNHAYIARNVSLVVTIVISISALIAMVYVLFKFEDNNFGCLLNNKVQQMIFWKMNETKLYVCTYNTNMHKSFMCTMILPLCLQLVFVLVWFTDNTDNIEKSECLSKEGRRAYHNIHFMVQFWKNSRPVNPGAIGQLVDHIFTQALIEIKVKLVKIMIDDNDMFKLYLYLKKDCWEDVILAIEAMKKNEAEHPASIRKKIKIFKVLEPKCPPHYFPKFFAILCKQKKWKMVANILVSKALYWVEDNSEADSNDSNIVPSKIIIDPNEIGKPFKEERSILHYLLDGKLLNKAGTKCIVQKFELRNSGYYVHSKGKTRKTSEILLSFTENEDRSNDTVAEMLVNMNSLKFEDQNKNNLSKYQEKNLSKYLQMLKDGENGIRICHGIAQELSRYKFSKWDRVRQELAKTAKDKQQWTVLVALLNAFIVYNENDTEPLDTGCEVTNFETEIGNTCETPQTEDGIIAAALFSEMSNLCLYGAKTTALRHIVKHRPVDLDSPSDKVFFSEMVKEQNYDESLKEKLKDLLDQLYSPPPAGTTRQSQSSPPIQVGTAETNPSIPTPHPSIPMPSVSPQARAAGQSPSRLSPHFIISMPTGHQDPIVSYRQDGSLISEQPEPPDDPGEEAREEAPLLQH